MSLFMHAKMTGTSIQLRRQLHRILLSLIAVVMSSSGTLRATLRRLSSLAAETNSRPWSARVLHVVMNSPLLRGRKATYMANTPNLLSPR